VGDDTGLLKKIEFKYNYQTEVHGFCTDKKVRLDAEGNTKKTEKYYKDQLLDFDGQPLYKEMLKDIEGR